MEKQDNLNNLPETLCEQDFTFVNADASLHDQNLETKPTTFFKDAIKRFCKSRSSVVAASILLILIGMSIVVPLADKNIIDKPLGAAKYLPPKWFDADLNGFLDGTGTVSNAVLDPDTGLLPSDSDYKDYAVIGDIHATSSYSDILSDAVLNYGKGGCMSIQNTSESVAGVFSGSDQGIASASVSIDLSETGHYFNVSIDKEQSSVASGTTLRGYAAFWLNEETIIPLCDTFEVSSASELNDIEVSDVSSKIASYASSNHIEIDDPSEVSGKYCLIVAAPEDEASAVNVLAVSKIACDYSKASFKDGISALKDRSKGRSSAYSNYGESKIGILHAEVLYGSFRYDYYEGVFGDIEGQKFSENDINNYIAKGWIDYEWGGVDGGGPKYFALTEEGEKYCPLRKVDHENIIPNYLDEGVGDTREVVGTLSKYRDCYAKGEIGSCAIPKYIFGTDGNGKDFFKVVFSGLLMSLGLGLFASIINIVIGLIWGAISGYFGGWVDMIMERFTEILGGVPFIIVMTLVALLWNKNGGGTTFWTFLFALCLTGWIGISSTTRSQFYRYKGREYVLASRTLGASDARLIFKHILPNAIGTIVTSAVLMIPSVIFTEANISYLLPGTLAISNTFGVALESVQSDIHTAPYLIISASLIMALLMISFNLFGNGLRDAFNPSLKGSDE